MLAINLLLLRRALAPLRQLTAFARQIDPLEPGHRLDVGGGDSDAAELAAAFNEMLERSRSSAATASAARSRRRRASGCGSRRSSTTASASRSGRRPAARTRRPGHAGPEPRAVLEAQETARDSLEEVRRIARMLRPEALDDLGLARRCASSASGSASTPSSRSTCTSSRGSPIRRGRRARRLPGRAGGADQRRPPRRRKRAEVRLELSGGQPLLQSRMTARDSARGRARRRRPRDARARRPDRRARCGRPSPLAAHVSPSSCRHVTTPPHPHPARRRSPGRPPRAAARPRGEPDLRVVAEVGDGAEAVERGLTTTSTSPSSTSRCRG